MSTKLLEQIRVTWPMLKHLDPPPAFSDATSREQAFLLATFLEDHDEEFSVELLGSLYAKQIFKEFCIGVLKNDHDPFPIYDLIRNEAERFYRDSIETAIMAEQHWWAQQNSDDEWIENHG